MPDEPPLATVESSPASLEYRPSAVARTRWVRLIILVLIALVIAALLPRMWTEFGYRVGRRAVQREMLTFTTPTDAVAVGPNPIQNVPYWQSNFGVPNYWPGNEDTLFLHERTSAGGTRRIVGIAFVHDTFSDIGPQSPTPMELRVATSEIVSFASSSTTHPKIWTDSVASYGWPVDSTRTTLHFGQPDANDASRFTIGYTVNGQTGTLAGHLKDDGTVTFTAKDGPLVGK